MQTAIIRMLLVPALLSVFSFMQVKPLPKPSALSKVQVIQPAFRQIAPKPCEQCKHWWDDRPPCGKCGSHKAYWNPR